jgi:hypothetical protein
MSSPSKSFIETFNIIIVILAVTMSIFGLLMGVANLIQPTVPEQYLDQNTRVCVGLIISSLVIIYAVFHPYSGGILICICAVLYFIIVNNILVYPIILLGILSIIRGHLNKGKELESSNDIQSTNK